MRLRYEAPLPIELAGAESQMASGEPALIADALLRASLLRVDASWVEAACLRSIEHPEPEVQWAAMLALGHLVRIHGYIDLDTLLSKFQPFNKDPRLWGRVDDLLDDIRTFLRDADESQLRKLKKAHTAHKEGLSTMVTRSKD